MSRLKDGGPAFPDPEGQSDYTGGLSVRQWYAGQIAAALSGATPHVIKDLKNLSREEAVNVMQGMGSIAFVIADGLIKAEEVQRGALTKYDDRVEKLETAITSALETLRLDDQWTPRKAQVEAMLNKAIGGE